MEIVLWIVFAIVVGAVSVAVVRRQERLRREAMSAWAAANGWSFAPDGDGAGLGPFKLAQQGRNHRTMSFLRRRHDGLDLTLCDHVYVTGSGRSRTVHRQTVCLVGDESARVPTFFLRRQVPILDAIGKLFGGQDVNFDDDPEFSGRYVLQSQQGDEQVRQAFTARVRAHFTERPADRLVAEGTAGRLMLHRGMFLKPDDLQPFVDEAVAIHRLWR